MLSAVWEVQGRRDWPPACILLLLPRQGHRVLYLQSENLHGHRAGNFSGVVKTSELTALPFGCQIHLLFTKWSLKAALFFGKLGHGRPERQPATL